MFKLNDRDQKIILDYIYLQVIKSILQNDFNTLERTPLRYKQPYIKLLDHHLKIVQQQLRNTKYIMQKEGVKVHKNIGQSDDSYVQYDYTWKNKAEGFIRLWKAGMAMETNKRMKALFSHEQNR